MPVPVASTATSFRTAMAASVLLVRAALGLTACGGSAAGEAKVYGPGPVGIDEALADLDANEAEIASRFGGMPTGAQGYPQAGYGGYAQPGYQAQPPAQPYAQPPPPPPPPPGASTPVPEEPRKPADAPTAGPPAPLPAEPSASSDEETKQEEERDRCEIACRALGSMKRAAEHVCRAAGSSDARCSRARERVASASARVAASCEECDG